MHDFHSSRAGRGSKPARGLIQGRSESLLQLLLLCSLLFGCFNLIGQLVFRAGREVLHVVGQIVRRRQSLSADRRLTTAEEGT